MLLTQQQGSYKQDYLYLSIGKRSKLLEVLLKVLLIIKDNVAFIDYDTIKLLRLIEATKKGSKFRRESLLQYNKDDRGAVNSVLATLDSIADIIDTTLRKHISAQGLKQDDNNRYAYRLHKGRQYKDYTLARTSQYNNDDRTSSRLYCLNCLALRSPRLDITSYYSLELALRVYLVEGEVLLYIGLFSYSLKGIPLAL